jgi:hypothetical protein
MFTFGHEVDRQLAFNRRPWTIKGAHLVLKTWPPKLTWQEVTFTSSTFWVQIHGLPRLWLHSDNLLSIRQLVGRVLEVDLVAEPIPQWRKFVRIRIEIEISNPLKPGIFLPRPRLQDVWIGLKYEKLSEFCFKCGVIGHTEKDCSLERYLLSNPFGVKFPAFGEWMRPENNKEPPDIYSKNDQPLTPQPESLSTGCSPITTLDSPSRLVVPLLPASLVPQWRVKVRYCWGLTKPVPVLNRTARCCRLLNCWRSLSMGSRALRSRA